MRMAEIHWAFPPTIGGVETHLALLLPALVRRGHTVTVLTGQPEGLPGRQVWDGVEVVRTPALDLNGVSIDAGFREAATVIHRFLRDQRPDLIHLHNLHYFSAEPLDAVLAYADLHAVPVVLTAHNTWDDALFRQIAGRAARYARIVAVSDFIRRDLVRLGYPGDRIVVIHHGLPDDWWQGGQPWSPHSEGPVIFHPARMSVGKGSAVVIRAFAKVRQRYPAARLVLAGTARTVDWHRQQASEIRDLIRLVEELAVADAVTWQPFDWQEMKTQYDRADIVLYPSVMPEPFGIVTIEAMARGRPLIVSDAGGLPEIVEHGVSGLVVPRGSVDALADAIAELWGDPDKARRLGQAARARVAARFRAGTMVDRTEAVLLQAAELVAEATR
jgi:glycogen(starch) synthase